jgi:hypothetical protein
MSRSILNRLRFFLTPLILLIAGVNVAMAQSTAFTYQGRVTDNTLYPDGAYDFEFRLFNALTGGTQDIAPIQRLNVEVTGGAFTASLDFGAGSFPGADRFLEIGIRTAGGAEFTTLTPRQQIMVTPYAIHSYSTGYATYALSATNAQNAVNAETAGAATNVSVSLVNALGSNLAQGFQPNAIVAEVRVKASAIDPNKTKTESNALTI